MHSVFPKNYCTLELPPLAYNELTRLKHFVNRLILWKYDVRLKIYIWTASSILPKTICCCCIFSYCLFKSISSSIKYLRSGNSSCECCMYCCLANAVPIIFQRWLSPWKLSISLSYPAFHIFWDMRHPRRKNHLACYAPVKFATWINGAFF